MATQIKPGLADELRAYGSEDVDKCFNCGNCSAVCVHSEAPNIIPRRSMHALQLGLEDKLKGSLEPWMCYYCGECSEQCPKEAEPGETMMSMRRWLTSKYDFSGLSGLFYRSPAWEVIAIILAALSETLLDDTPHGPIEVVFTVQEEVGLFGATYLTAGLKADFGYVLDGDGPVGSIANQAPSKVDLDFVVTGRAAHAGVSPEAGINAIVTAAKAIARLRTGRIDAHTTSNVGCISGGAARNIVPERAEVAVEVRSTDTAKLEGEVQAVLDAFTQEAAAAGAHLDVRRQEPFKTFTVDQTHPVVANAFRAAHSLGIEPRLWTSGGGMDANVFNSRGLACVGLGIGGEKAHSPQERIAVAQMETGVAFLKAILKETASR